MSDAVLLIGAGGGEDWGGGMGGGKVFSQSGICARDWRLIVGGVVEADDEEDDVVIVVVVIVLVVSVVVWVVVGHVSWLFVMLVVVIGTGGELERRLSS